MKKIILYLPFLLTTLTQSIVLASSAGSPAASPTTSPNGTAATNSTSTAPTVTSNGLQRSAPVQIQASSHSSNGNGAKPTLTSRSASFSASAAAIAAGSPPQFSSFMPAPSSNHDSRRGSMDRAQYTATLMRPPSAQANGASSNGASKAKHVGPSKNRFEDLQALTTALNLNIGSLGDRIQQTDEPTTPKSMKVWAVKKALCTQILNHLKMAAGPLSLLTHDDSVILSMAETINKVDADRTPSPVTTRSSASSVSAATSAASAATLPIAKK